MTWTTLFRPRAARRPAARSVVRPRLETLEDRTVPTANFRIDGDLMTIIALNGPSGSTTNNIVIADNGTSNPNNIVVVSNGASFRPNVAIDRVNVIGGASTEHIVYNLTSEVASNRKVNVFLGAGNDSFDSSIRRDIDSGVSVAVTANGGGGNDTMTMTLVGDLQDSAQLSFFAQGGAGDDTVRFQTTSFVQAVDGSQITLNLFGDTVGSARSFGNDRVGISFNGELDGTMKFQALGQGGNDSLTAAVGLTAASTGTLIPSQLLGGGGDDTLIFLVRNNSDTAITFNQLLDGGPGFDTDFRTNFVFMKNCEVDHVLA